MPQGRELRIIPEHYGVYTKKKDASERGFSSVRVQHCHRNVSSVLLLSVYKKKEEKRRKKKSKKRKRMHLSVVFRRFPTMPKERELHVIPEYIPKNKKKKKNEKRT